MVNAFKQIRLSNLNVSGKNSSQFTINGESSKGVYWTTFGDIF